MNISCCIMLHRYSDKSCATISDFFTFQRSWPRDCLAVEGGKSQATKVGKISRDGIFLLPEQVWWSRLVSRTRGIQQSQSKHSSSNSENTKIPTHISQPFLGPKKTSLPHLPGKSSRKPMNTAIWAQPCIEMGSKPYKLVTSLQMIFHSFALSIKNIVFDSI